MSNFATHNNVDILILILDFIFAFSSRFLKSILKDVKLLCSSTIAYARNESIIIR